MAMFVGGTIFAAAVYMAPFPRKICDRAVVAVDPQFLNAVLSSRFEIPTRLRLENISADAAAPKFVIAEAVVDDQATPSQYAPCDNVVPSPTGTIRLFDSMLRMLLPTLSSTVTFIDVFV
jgi:hypothetical protein